jgi:hypothetical protein
VKDVFAKNLVPGEIPLTARSHRFGNGSARAETSVKAAARASTISITMRCGLLRDTLDDDLSTIIISPFVTYIRLHWPAGRLLALDSPAPLSRCAVRLDGQREVKNGTSVQVGGHPQPSPMGLDDRPANRQPHPHAVRFGRKQWIEYPIDGARLDTLPRVLHRHHHAAEVVNFRP